MGKKNKGRHRGRYCLVCGCRRPNEAFGGRGLSAKACKRCRQKGKDVVRHALDAEYFYRLLEQRNVSDKNRAFLARVAQEPRHPLAASARFGLRVVTVAPHRCFRQRTLSRQAPELVLVAAEEGWIEEDAWYRIRSLHEVDDLEATEIELFDWPAPAPRAVDDHGDHLFLTDDERVLMDHPF